MHFMSKQAEFTTKDAGIANLKESVKARDQMGGAMYWTLLNEDCCEIANKIVGLGVTPAEKEEIANILGKENFR